MARPQTKGRTCERPSETASGCGPIQDTDNRAEQKGRIRAHDNRSAIFPVDMSLEKTA